jgi:hypothetical protein
MAIFLQAVEIYGAQGQITGSLEAAVLCSDG